METDPTHMMENNYRYTLESFNWAQECGIFFSFMPHRQPPDALTVPLLKIVVTRDR